MGTLNNVRHYSNDLLKDLNISIKSTDQEIIDHMKNIKNKKINFNIEKRIAQRSVCLLGWILLWRRDKWVNDRFVRLLRKLGYFTN